MGQFDVLLAPQVWLPTLCWQGPGAAPTARTGGASGGGQEGMEAGLQSASWILINVCPSISDIMLGCYTPQAH